MTRSANQKRLYTRDVIVWENDCQFVEGEAVRMISFGLDTDVALVASAPAIGLFALLRFTHPNSCTALTEAQANPWRFADTGIALLLAGFRARGAEDQEIQLRAIGGSGLDQSGQACTLGSQNNRSMRRILWKEGLLLKGQDLGENVRRSIWYAPDYDRLLVRTSSFADTSQALGRSGVTVLAS